MIQNAPLKRWEESLNVWDGPLRNRNAPLSRCAQDVYDHPIVDGFEAVDYVSSIGRATSLVDIAGRGLRWGDASSTDAQFQRGLQQVMDVLDEVRCERKRSLKHVLAYFSSRAVQSQAYAQPQQFWSNSAATTAVGSSGTEVDSYASSGNGQQFRFFPDCSSAGNVPSRELSLSASDSQMWNTTASNYFAGRDSFEEPWENDIDSPGFFPGEQPFLRQVTDSMFD
mmetsp:Transcript_153904/g.283389  ORF Transcript_153904/g.283389 Transcript_153904/m.283389 type:complete len:225 (+) Transcript_153904:31-705(+)